MTQPTWRLGAGVSDMKAGWARLTALGGQFEATEFFQLTLGEKRLGKRLGRTEIIVVKE